MFYTVLELNYFSSVKPEKQQGVLVHGKRVCSAPRYGCLVTKEVNYRMKWCDWVLNVLILCCCRYSHVLDVLFDFFFYIYNY